MMRAIEIQKPGGPEVLIPCQRERPQPGPGEVLIEVHAAGINRPDALQRAGLYRAPPQASDLPGLEVAGIIVEGDCDASDLKPGDAVCALTPGGGYAQYCVAPAAHCLPVPQGLDMVQAAALPETCFTVWSNVFERAALQAGESLLVHGGSSGIGTTAIQIAHALGHRVFATAGNPDKAQACARLGAHAINYRESDFVSVVREHSNNSGVDVILDMVGGDYTARNLACLADDGRLVIIGLLGGVKAEVPLAQILLRRLSVTGSTLRPRSNAYKAELARALKQQVWPLIEAGKVRPVIDSRYPLEHASRAHARMESGEHIGKLVLDLRQAQN